MKVGTALIPIARTSSSSGETSRALSGQPSTPHRRAMSAITPGRRYPEPLRNRPETARRLPCSDLAPPRLAGGRPRYSGVRSMRSKAKSMPSPLPSAMTRASSSRERSREPNSPCDIPRAACLPWACRDSAGREPAKLDIEVFDERERPLQPPLADVAPRQTTSEATSIFMRGFLRAGDGPEVHRRGRSTRGASRASTCPCRTGARRCACPAELLHRRGRSHVEIREKVERHYGGFTKIGLE